MAAAPGTKPLPLTPAQPLRRDASELPPGEAPLPHRGEWALDLQDPTQTLRLFRDGIPISAVPVDLIHREGPVPHDATQTPTQVAIRLRNVDVNTPAQGPTSFYGGYVERSTRPTLLNWVAAGFTPTRQHFPSTYLRCPFPW